ncbi:Polr2d [Scenedesmus sp. PABB004]|nr:Polr2d [Scenedesmus sp. PABB004]
MDAQAGASKTWAPPPLAAKAMEYLDRVEAKAHTANADTVARVREVVQGAAIHEFEMALLANLVPETAEDAMALVPSLNDARFADNPAALQNVLDEIITLKELHFVVAASALKPEQLAAAALASWVVASPALAVLPEGFKSPQGSDTAALESLIDALPTPAAPKPDAPLKEAPALVVAPSAPAVVEPPPRAAPVEEAPARPAAGLQARASAPDAPAPSGGPSGLAIGVGVAVLGAAAAAALAGNSSGEAAPAAAAPAPAAPAGDAPPAPDAAAAPAPAEGAPSESA